jgi:hypothetical protein
MLKTTTGAIEFDTAGNKTLPGGSYGFYPQFKVEAGFGAGNDIYLATDLPADQQSYVTSCYLNPVSPGSSSIFVQQTYITASGEDHWLFLLMDKNTKRIHGKYSASDHPAYGNGGDYNKRPHPFMAEYDEARHEIILVDKESIAELKAQVTKDKDLLDIINESYRVDLSKEETYQPLHSGKYIIRKDTGEIVKSIPLGDDLTKYAQVKEMVEVIPSYIKVRKLVRMTEQEKIQKQQDKEQRIAQAEQEKQEKKQALLDKLKITNEDLKILKEVL